MHWKLAKWSAWTGYDLKLGIGEVGRMVGFVLVQDRRSSPTKEIDGSADIPAVCCGELVGPVEPGLPRFDSLKVVVESRIALADAEYWGGHQGATLCWWVRTQPDGDRVNITEPTPVPVFRSGDSDGALDEESGLINGEAIPVHEVALFRGGGEPNVRGGGEPNGIDTSDPLVHVRQHYYLHCLARNCWPSL